LTVAGRKITRRATVAWSRKNAVRRIGTQENCGLHKELDAVGIRATRCAKVARGRENGLQRKGKDDITPRTQKGRTEENRRLSPECKNGVRYRGLRQQFQGKIGVNDPRTRWQLRLMSERTTSEFARKAFGLEFVKRANGTCNGLRKIRWRGRPPPKRKKR
jgi:hypothetical protein